MNNFKVDQARTTGFVVIDHIVRSSITMRPRPTKITAPELMSAAEFDASRFDHFACERAFL